MVNFYKVTIFVGWKARKADFGLKTVIFRGKFSNDRTGKITEYRNATESRNISLGIRSLYYVIFMQIETENQSFFVFLAFFAAKRHFIFYLPSVYHNTIMVNMCYSFRNFDIKFRRETTTENRNNIF